MVGRPGYLVEGGGNETLPAPALRAKWRLHGHDFIDLLKIDIEGFEYEVLESCLQERIPLIRFASSFTISSLDPQAKTKEMIRSLASEGLI